jgi:hypothetical protein
MLRILICLFLQSAWHSFCIIQLKYVFEQSRIYVSRGPKPQ